MKKTLGSKKQRKELIRNAINIAWDARKEEELERLNQESAEDTDIEKAIKRIEKKKNGAQSDLAKMAGISQNEVYRIENGGIPKLTVALQLETGVGGKISWMEFMLGRRFKSSDFPDRADSLLSEDI